MTRNGSWAVLYVLTACEPKNIRYPGAPAADGDDSRDSAGESGVDSGVPAEDTGPCSGDETREGDVTLADQAEIDAFCAGSCTVQVTGTLEIQNTDATNLVGLSCLTFAGSVVILDNDALTSLVGLDALGRVGDEEETGGGQGGDLYILDNDSLLDLQGLGAVDTVGGRLIIDANAALTSLEGLDLLRGVTGGVYIDGNHGLTSLAGLEGLAWVESPVYIGSDYSAWGTPAGEGNDGLTSLAGLATTWAVPGLWVQFNDGLTSMAGFDVASTSELYVEHNAGLVSLDGMEGLTSLGYLVLEDNASLADISALSTLDQIGGFQFTGNPSLESLGGLDNLTVVGSDWGGCVCLTGNTALTDVRALYGVTFAYYALITDNTALPTAKAQALVDEIDLLATGYWIDGNAP